jgi:hypothetical protein
MVRIYPCLKEPNGLGYKQLYPNNYSQIIELQSKINSRPRTVDQAKNNRFINNQIKLLEQEIKDGKES